MEDSIENFIKTHKIFSSLDEATRNEVLRKFSKLDVAQHEVLYYQGEPSNTLYILLKGKLAAELTTLSGETITVGHLNPGETIGETSILTNEPHSLTVKAVKDSELLRLPANEFLELCRKYPDILISTIQPILTRSSTIIQKNSADKKNKNIIIVPANSETSLEKFFKKIHNLTERFPSVLTLSDYHPEFSDKELDQKAIKEKILLLAKDKKPSHRIIYILSSYNTPLAKIGFKRADMIYIAADSQVAPKIDQPIIDKIDSLGFHFKSFAELILIHPDNTVTPKNTAAWLAQMHFSLHHHIRLNNLQDLHRLLRFIRGKAVGVVLSGGGTRGWAHVGAIKALLNSKIPIDIIGGTSVGAIVGACYAISQSYEETLEKFNQVVTQSNYSVSWRSLTWPAISLFNAKNFTKVQQDVFDGIRIEDMWLPYFCNSCNLATCNEDIHKTGVLWERTRASSALPGIIPPMVLDGDIHLDGGLLNNLPVDIMRQYVGIRGKIIAVDLNSFAPESRKFNFPPILTFTEALMAKIGRGITHYKFPSFTDTFLRGLFVGSSAKSKQNSLASNIFVNLNLSKFRLLYSDPKQVNNLIEIGYQETLLKCMYETNKKM